MVLAAIFSAFIANISPSWGLFFIILLGGKYFTEQKYVFLSVFSITSIALYFLMRNGFEKYTVLETTLAVGIAYYLIFWVFFRTGKLSLSLIILMVYEALFAFFRSITYEKILLNRIIEVFDESKLYFEEKIADPTQLNQILLAWESVKKIFENYGFALWVSSFLIAGYFGFIFLSKKEKIELDHSQIQMPFYLVYLFIIGLVTVLITETRLLGINIIVAIFPLFFFQGISILDFFWHEFFKRSKILTGILIVALVLNIYMWILISFMGLVDIWLNFRKINVLEEKNASNIN